MSKVHVCRKHDLGEVECKALAVKLLERLVGEFGGDYKVEGNSYRYKHTTGINAQVMPKAGELLVDVKLGLLTRSFAPALEKKMNEVLDDYLV